MINQHIFLFPSLIIRQYHSLHVRVTIWYMYNLVWKEVKRLTDSNIDFHIYLYVILISMINIIYIIKKNYFLFQKNCTFLSTVDVVEWQCVLRYVSYWLLSSYCSLTATIIDNDKCDTQNKVIHVFFQIRYSCNSIAIRRCGSTKHSLYQHSSINKLISIFHFKQLTVIF